jgi:circadian clock protein KaiC
VARIRALLLEHRAKNLVIDPISALAQAPGDTLAEEAAIQILDIAKSQGITSVSTSLLGNKAAFSEETPIGISTVADTWMHLTYVNQGGERNRALTIIKSRGTGHSNQVRELVLAASGVTLADVYSVGGEVLMGTLRWQREDEGRRGRELAARDAGLREREAELALAETEARAQVVAGERAIRQATLERIRVVRQEEILQATAKTVELRRRRGADGVRGKTVKQVPRRSS